VNSVISTAFYLPFGLREADRASVKSAFVQDLLCYDRVCVLSDQMAALGPLLAELGPDLLEQLIDQGGLNFVHDRQILSWPIWLGFSGPSPVLALESFGAAGGFTQTSTSDIALHLALAADLPFKRARHLSRIIENATVDFGGLPGEPEHSGASGMLHAVTRQLETYQEAVAPGDPLTPAEIGRIIRELKKPNRNPSGVKKHRVARLETRPGWAALENDKGISRKQFALLNMFLADRTIAVLGQTGLEGTVHADPAVEQVFAARLNHVRLAGGNELTDLLDAAEVHLPALSSPNEMDYGSLLSARDTAAGRAFRKRIVSARDSDADLDLTQAYVRSLRDRLGDRVEIKAIRFLTTTVAGLVPGLGPAASALDTLLVDKILARFEPTFFIDQTLRKIGDGTARSERQRRVT